MGEEHLKSWLQAEHEDLRKSSDRLKLNTFPLWTQSEWGKTIPTKVATPQLKIDQGNATPREKR